MERTITSTRVLQAPRERVWKAWTDPTLLTQWWGPTGFSNIFHAFDLRPGGAWRLDMRGPDGALYPNHSVFEEVVAPERLVYDHLSDSGHDFKVSVDLKTHKGGTELVWQMLFYTDAEFLRVRDLIQAANEQNLDKLEALLQGEKIIGGSEHA